MFLFSHNHVYSSECDIVTDLHLYMLCLFFAYTHKVNRNRHISYYWLGVRWRCLSLVWSTEVQAIMQYTHDCSNSKFGSYSVARWSDNSLHVRFVSGRVSFR